VKHVRKVCEILVNANLTIKPTKVQLGQSCVLFLGHVIGSGFKKIPPDRLLLISQFRRPENRAQVRRYLGLLSYFHSFVPDYSRRALPFTNLLRSVAPEKVIWTAELEEAFTSLNASFAQNSILAAPDFTRVLFVYRCI